MNKEKNYILSGNEEFYKSESDRVKRDAKTAERERKSGLKASAKAKDGADYSNKTAVKESVEPMKRLVFRNTTFLSESQVLNRVPENVDDLHADMVNWPDNNDKSAWYYLAVQEATNSHDYKMKNHIYEKWTAIRKAADWTKYE